MATFTMKQHEPIKQKPFRSSKEIISELFETSKNRGLSSHALFPNKGIYPRHLSPQGRTTPSSV
jgi:hypothetical protein